jgi:SAM-dependent methyltransferase
VLSLVSQEKDLLFYAREVESRQGPVLVLGAGTGRLPWELALRGVASVAVEPSEVMLQLADERRAQEPPEASGRLELHCADVRAVRLSQQFGVVLAPQNALALMATLDDLDALLATVRHHLAPDGIFAFDVLNPHRDPFHPPHEPEEGWRPMEGVEPPRPVFAPHLRERTRSVDGVSEGIRRLRLRHFTVAEIDQALREADFVATERYGGFDRQPFEPHDPLQIVVAIRGRA